MRSFSLPIAARDVSARGYCSLACLLVLLVAGCPAAPSTENGGPQTESSASTTPQEEPLVIPAGWQHLVGKETPDIPVAPQKLPATVQSDDGVEVTVTDTSRTIVGNDDIIVVMEVLGLSDHVFAAPTSTVTAVGRNAPHHFLFNRTTGVEGVLSLDGTLFIGNSLRRHGKLAGPLRDAGQAVVIVDELQPAPEKVRKIAAVFGYAEQGEQLAAVIQQQLDQAAKIAETHPRKPRVIHVSATGGGGTPTVAGADTAAAELIRLAGGINVGDETKVANYSQLSNEGIVAAEPEVILVSESDLIKFGGEQGLWKAYPSLKQTPAGLANRVWVMPDLQFKMTSIACGTGAITLAEALAELAAQPAP